MRDMTSTGSILGNPVRRVEDPRLLRGEAEFVEDLTPLGTAHLVFVRSSMAHARLTTVDTAAAATIPGVVLVATHDTLGLPKLQGFVMLPPAFNRPPLADGVVRFVGDIIAVVVAETRAAAIDAAEAVIVDYEPLPVVVDPEAALAADAPLLFPEHGSNLAIEMAFGEDATIFDGADVVVKARFVNQRLAAVPMESNGVLVEPGPDDKLTVTVPTQGPFGVRDPLAAALGLEPAQVRVVAPAVGGGFGAKSGAYCEYVIAAAVARRLERPVKWTETRSENMVAMTHGRAQVQHVELGVTRDGIITGLRGRIVGDGGAYPAIGAFLPYLTRMMSQGVYDIPKVEISIRSAATNTTPTAAYRGAGRPEATQMLERIIDIAADELGIDPVEMRRRNLLPPERFPLTTVTGANYDVGEYAKALDEALRVAGYDELLAEQAARRERSDAKQLGIGVATYVEVTAGGLFQEFAAVEAHEDGHVTATVGTSAHGQGHETSFAMIVSQLLGVPMESVTLIQSDTALVLRGGGTMGSRSLQIGGSALYRASEGLVSKARELAARVLEADVADIVFDDGRFAVAGVPATALGWAELAQVVHDNARRPPDMEPALAVALDFDQGEASYPFGAHVAVVEVDLQTGKVALLRHVAVDDCGRIINPLLVAGQQHGGIAQGIAQALFEGVVYDDDGNPLTATLIDYTVPSAAEFPTFEASNTVTPTPLNPLGAKGIGESGTIGSTPAVHNAVIDAVSYLGVRHIDMPLTPERVWRALLEGTAAEAPRDW
jgi:carbon-monoxide dehydrogenase large subunit